MSDQGFPIPKSAREVPDDSRIPAEDLEKEIGDSEGWDEASNEVWDDASEEAAEND